MNDLNEKRSHQYWSHFHKIVEICNEGNQEVFDKIKDLPTNKRHYVIANIPEKYYKYQFETIKDKLLKNDENQEPIKRIEKYFESLDSAVKKGIGLYICGPHGTAKTTISTIILKMAIKKYFRCFFWKSTDIVEFIKSGWKNEYRKIFFDYVINNVDFLVIDDVARLFETRDESEKLYIDKVFTRRDDLNLPTIITTHRPLNENKEVFGEALYSNFKERLIEVNIIGDDFRYVINDKLIKDLN